MKPLAVPLQRWCWIHGAHVPGAVDLSYKDRFRAKNKLLVCRLVEFLSQSNNPFEVLFNLLQFFAKDFLLAEISTNMCATTWIILKASNIFLNEAGQALLCSRSQPPACSLF